MIFTVFAGLVLIFGFVLFYGAPYLPTHRKQAATALDMLDLKKGQTLYELGCGDGRVLKEAAKRGINCVGYELNPILVVFAWFYTFRYRRLVKVVWGNFWKADLAPADGIFVFLIKRFMVKLDKKIVAEGSEGVKLVSYAFKVPKRKVALEKDALFLYKY